MNRMVKSFVGIIVGGLLSTQVLAQTIVIGDGTESGVGGDAIVVDITFTPGSDVAGVDMDLTYDETQFSSVTLDCGVQTVGASINFCSDADAATGKIDVINSCRQANGKIQVANGLAVVKNTQTNEYL